MPKDSEGYYAHTRWHPSDIQQAVSDNLNLKITEEQAEDWLANNERSIADRSVELGWDIISALMDRADFQPTPLTCSWAASSVSNSVALPYTSAHNCPVARSRTTPHVS
jgi:hypothetical protein